MTLLLNLNLPTNFFNYFLVIAIFVLVAVLITRKSKILGILYCGIFGPMLISAIMWWTDADRYQRLQESELVYRTPEIYTTLYEQFVRLDENNDGQLDKPEIFNYVSDDSIIEQTLSQVRRHFESIASVKIIRGRRHYVQSVDRNDLENLKHWALSKWH